MNFKTTYILFGALALVLIGLTIALYVSPTPKDEDKSVFPSVNSSSVKSNPDEVERVEIVRTSPEEKLTFVKDPSTKRWRVNGFRANANSVKNLISKIYDAKKTETEAARNLGEWGLENPQTVVTLRRGDKSALTLSIGKTSPGDDASAVTYVLSSDRPKDPMGVLKSQLEIVTKDLATFRERELIAESSAELQSVDLVIEKKPNGPPSVGLKMTSSGGWIYTAPERFKGGAVETSGGTAPDEKKAPTNVQALLSDLTSIKVEGDKGEDFVADDVKDLSKYNLGDSDEKLVITFERSEPNLKTTTETLLVGIGKDAPKKGDEPEKVYACIKGENNVVKITRKNLAPLIALLEKPDALRDRHLIKLEGSKTPDAIILRNVNTYETKDGKKVEKKLEFYRTAASSLPLDHPPGIPMPSGSWKMYRDDEAVEVDPSVVNQLVQVLTSNTVETFPDATATPEGLGVANPNEAEAVVEVWIDGIAPPEKKEGDKKEDKKEDKTKPKLKDPKKPTVTLTFGKKVANKTAPVKRVAEGETPALLYVQEIVYDKVTARPLDFMSKTLPTFRDLIDPFTFKGVTRLELTRDGKDLVVVREAGKDDTATWKIEKPEELKGRKADEAAVAKVLGALGGLQAVSLEAEKPTADALEAIYGLGKSATVKAVVTVVTKVKDKDNKEKEEKKTFEYRFGKTKNELDQFATETIDPKPEGKRDVIFTVKKNILTDFPQEMLDTTVFSMPNGTRLDTTKVKAVKLEGWYNLEKVTKTLEIEKSPAGNWIIKGTGKPALSSNIEKLLRAMADLTVVKFVAHGQPKPDPGYEFETDKGALVITLTVEGQAEPLKLTLGKLDADLNYFAISPQLKGDIFQVKKDEFKDARSAPGYFIQ